jgi:hypothetical protein
MKLFNQTPVVARLDTSDIGGSHRIGLVTAKATFRFDLDGNVTPETQAPVPLFAKDETVAGGLLPADLEPRRNPVFEVILLGHAYAPQQKPVKALTAALSVGSTRRELRVSGDRSWVKDEAGAITMTPPQPFIEMPLGYERAFGGRAVARIDEHSEMPLYHTLNPHGRGFDAGLMALQLGHLLRAPSGFPVLVDPVRALPNVESPSALVLRPEDVPEPASWATLPLDVPLHLARKAPELVESAKRLVTPAEAPSPSGAPPELPASEDPFAGAEPMLYRAHPDWLLPVPAEAPQVRLENLVKEKADLTFQLPDERIVADYVIGERTGSRPLVPQMLVLLPDEHRFFLLYRLPFTYAQARGEERAFRIRVEAGWFSGGKR